MQKFILSLALLGAAGISVHAAEKKMDKAEHKDGDTMTVVGMMAVKAKDAKKDVVCRLTTGKNKNDMLYNLVATGDLAKKIEEMRQNGDKVKVVGKLNGESIEVEKIERVVYMKK